MRIASICAVSALVLGFVHSHALAQDPPTVPRPNITELEEVRNTYIFKFNPRVPQAAMAGIAHRITSEAGGTVRHVYTDVLGGFAATVPGAAVWTIAGKPEVIGYERDQIATIFAPPNCGDNDTRPACNKEDDGGEEGDDSTGDPVEIADCSANYSSTELPWGVDRIDADVAHGDGNCGQGVHVYVLDTGIDLDHPDLMPVDGVDCTQTNCPSGGDDKNGHGTHVAGTIAARINGSQVVGVAPAVYLHAVQVLGPSGRGSYSDIIAGVQYVARKAQEEVDGIKRGPVVANLSLGGSGEKADGTDCSSGSVSKDDALHYAMCEAAHDGVVFVVAAGNSYADAEGFVPAAYDDTVITVSATNEADDWPSWSNWGDDPAPWLTGDSAPVTIAAPGVSILSTDKGGGTSIKSGTSMASPHVAGIAALLLSGATYGNNNYSTFTEIRTKILDDAITTGNWNNTSGKPHAEKFGCAAEETEDRTPC